MSVRLTMLENAKSWSGITRAKRLKGLIVAVAVTFGLGLTQGGVSLAQDAPADPNSQYVTSAPKPLGAEEQQILLNEIESYFDTVTTMKARFIQVNMDGTVYQGDMVLQRPGKMRIDYDAPIPYKIISDGTFYIFVDESLKEVSHIPLGLTPADMLLRQPMRLGDELMVVDAARDNGNLFITVAQKEAEDAGTLTLAFSESPLALRQWTVIDNQGIITRVLLENPQVGVPVDSDLFHFSNPWLGKDSR